MKTKTYFHELSEKDKRKFYLQEIFNDFNIIKLRVLVIITIMVVFDFVLTSFIAPIFDPTYPKQTSTVRTVLLILAPIVYTLPYINRLQPYLDKLGRYKILIHCIATLLYGTYLFLVNLDYLDKALQSGKHQDWSHAYIALSLSIHITIMMNLISPTWYIRMVIAGAYYLAIVVAFVKNETSEKEWIIIRNVFSFFYVLCLLILTSNFRWRLFVKSSELEAWTQVYADILNGIPSSIFVIDADGNIVYKNQEFEKLSDGNQPALFENITKLKMRESGGLYKNMEQSSAVRLNFNESQPFIFKEEVIPSLGIISPSHKSLTSLNFNNLNDALNYFKLRLMTTSGLDQEQTIFDAKVTKSASQLEAVHSYEVIFRPLLSHQKIIVILNNTTQRDLIASLEDNNEFKDKLLASVSHELRTPLNGNLGFLQAAINEPDISPTYKEKLLLPALRSGKLLLHLINDILDFSKIQRKKILLHHELKSLQESMEYCYGLFEHVFKAKNLGFRVDIDPSLPTMIRTDHNRLVQILINLLSNALKFTMRGKVLIRVKRHADPSCVEIKVTDTGIGISLEESSRLFDENISNKSPLTASVVGASTVGSKGVGLGLKVANRLARLLGPKGGPGIQVKSKNGKGSEFCFVLMHQPQDWKSGPNGESIILNQKSRSRVPSINLDYVHEEDGVESDKTTFSAPEIPMEYIQSTKKSAATLDLPSWHKVSIFKKNDSFRRKENTSEMTSANSVIFVRKVLIVDDDLFNILALSSLLKQSNIVVDSVNNGAQALEKILKEPLGWSLIFMDCQMPVMDGYEATRQLSEMMEKGEIPVIPIVGYTAFSTKDKLEECIRSGMREVVSKPAMIERVREVVQKYLK